MSTYIDKKFIDILSCQFRNFKWKKPTLANCSCPICGDSSTNKRKARGFFFQKGNDFFYMCHNCGFSSTLYNFIKQVSPNHAKEYSFERWKNGETGHSNYPKPVEAPMEAPKFNNEGELECIHDLQADHPAVRFCVHRKIPREVWKRLFYTNDFGNLARKLDPTLDIKRAEARIVIPFFDSKRNLIAVSGRLLEVKSKSDIRYMTVKCNSMIERLWYGIEECDPSKRVYVLEGPLDSLFIPNAVALVGASNFALHSKIASSDVVVVLDNEPRNREIVSLLERFIENGFRVCVWDETVEEKDINDMVLAGKTTEEITQYIDSRACSGIEAKLKVNAWKRV